jgi:hypothetical protein
MRCASPQVLAVGGLSLALACLAGAVTGALAGDWIADRKTGCRVWNSNPTAQESLSWSGRCKDGLAEGAGVVQWFRDGLPFERDEGQWQGGGKWVTVCRFGLPVATRARFATVSRTVMDGSSSAIRVTMENSQPASRMGQVRFETPTVCSKASGGAVAFAMVGDELLLASISHPVPNVECARVTATLSMEGLPHVPPSHLRDDQWRSRRELGRHVRLGRTLPVGAAMPLEELQEILRVGESVSLTKRPVSLRTFGPTDRPLTA